MRSPPTIATTSANPKVKGVGPAAGPTRHPASHSTRRTHSIRRRQAAPGSSPDNSSASGKGERPFNKEGATFPSRTIMRPPWQNNQKPRPDNVGRGTRGLDGDRTHDLLFRRQTLYPLSYKPEQLLYCTPHHGAYGTYVAKITRKSPSSALQWGYVGTYR